PRSLSRSFVIRCPPLRLSFLLSIDTAPTEIYTLSLHDALPIYRRPGLQQVVSAQRRHLLDHGGGPGTPTGDARMQSHQTLKGHRSEEHTSELQSRENLVCRLLLEKKKEQATRKARDPGRPRNRH